MKNILINLTNIKKGGGVQVALTLLEELFNYLERYKIYVFLSEELFNVQFKRFNDVYYIKSKNNQIHNLFFLKKNEIKLNIDIVFSLFGPGIWKPKTTHISGFAIPHLIYPDSPFFLRKKTTLSFRLFIQKLMFQINIDKYIVESEDSKLRLSSIMKIKKENIFIVSNTYNQKFDNIDYKLKLPSNKYKIFCPTSYYPHKNLEILLNIDEKISFNNENIQIFTTINSEVFDKIFKKSNNIINLGPLNLDKLTLKYSEMDLVLSTSLLECFSANYIEAFKTKTPLLTNDLDFSTRNCKNAAMYYKCNDSIDLYNKIIHLKSNFQLSKKLITNGEEILNDYETPKSRIEKYFKIIDEI